jgi:hypothetical protein
MRTNYGPETTNRVRGIWRGVAWTAFLIVTAIVLFVALVS